MTEKERNALANATLNAIIEGGYFRGELIHDCKDRFRLNQKALRDIEEQLREYYSTDIHASARQKRTANE